MANPQAEPSMEDILASIRRIIAEDDEPATAAETPAEPVAEPVALAAVEDAPVEESVRSVPEAVETEDAPAADETPLRTANAALEALTDMPATTEEPEAVTPAAVEEATGLDDFGGEPSVSTLISDAVAAVQEEPAPEVEFPGQFGAVNDAAPVDAAVDAFAAAKEVAEPAPAVEMTADAEKEEALVSTTRATAAAHAFGALEANIRIANGEGNTMEDLVQKMLEPMLAKWLEDNLQRIVEEKVEEEVRRISRRR